MVRALLLCLFVSGCVTDSKITVTVSGDGMGTVTSEPTGLMCGTGGSICTLKVDAEGLAKLIATPTAPDTFAGWSGDCYGVGDCNLDASFDAMVDAKFTKAPAPVQ
ncbi:MAG TPA: hypothetical protein VLB44_11105 [Kofleriaceae bacterium]|nr:hypothetical protein [Kofleriaceae bacterium]